MWHIRESHGVKYLLSDSALAGGFVAGFTTRLGGVSSLSYSSLNLGLHVGDARERVITNRRRFAAALGVDLGCMVFAEQVHSNRVEIVNTQHCGMGVLEQETAVSKTDGLITSEAGVMLVLTFADCVPVILFEPESSVAAVVHAGWRGTAASIVRTAVSLITARFKVSPISIRALIGPSIGQCCYKVSCEVAASVRSARLAPAAGDAERSGEQAQCPRDIGVEPGRRVRLDLASENVAQLLDAGVPSRNIEHLKTCTSCHSDLFFSHRAGRGTTGRFAAFAYIPLEGL